LQLRKNHKFWRRPKNETRKPPSKNEAVGYIWHMITQRETSFMQQAIAESLEGMEAGHGGPFGCVVVQNNRIIAAAHNEVLLTNDPTAHAEVVAIRRACAALGSFQLTGCEVYCSCEPCPMCFGALYWARPAKIFFANTKQDAAAIGFDDAFIYAQLALPATAQTIPMMAIALPAAKAVFDAWAAKGNKHLY
jgi:tRNA(Arg) A34 adenosine deaminase TadA